MLDFIIVVCAIFGLAFFIKESDGPWGVMALIRNKLMKDPYVGVFFYKLLDCYFCLGFHCGWFVYLLYAPHWQFQFLILWGLAGGMLSLIMDLIMTRLSMPASVIGPTGPQGSPGPIGPQGPAAPKRTTKTSKVKDG